MTNAELEKLVSQVLQDWGVAVLQRLSQEIQRRNLVLSGELLKSLQFEVLRSSTAGVAGLKLAFQQSGRMRDMKFVDHRKLPPIEVLEDYVRRVGVNNFKYVPGYRTGRLPTESRAVNRIAWGIARSRQNSNTYKPKKWFSKPFYGTIDPLITKLLDPYARAAGEAITENLNTSN